MIGIDTRNFGPPYFIHSDIFAVRQLLAGKKLLTTAVLLPAHQEMLEQSLGEEIALPAFNYDFPKTGLFDPLNDSVQVGVLPNYIHGTGTYHRTDVPMYSVISKQKMDLGDQDVIRPFSAGSFFEYLHRRQGTVVFYGATFSSMTFIHYIESLLGMPLYRYDKEFVGHIRKDVQKHPCKLQLHVRPMGVHLDYDWSVIEADLRSAGILLESSCHPRILYASTDQLIDFIGKKVKSDPFYLIDQESKAFFKEKTKGGSVRVELKDFEQ